MTQRTMPVGPPSASHDERCAQAMRTQLTGHPETAESLYRGILQEDPAHAMANHCFGMLQLQLRRATEGLPFLQAALNAAPEVPAYWLGYLEALLAADQLAEARATLQLGRQHGLAGADVESYDERLASRKAAEPDRSTRRRDARDAKRDEAALLRLLAEHRLAEALSLARSATVRFPERGLAWKILGVLLDSSGQLEDALHAMLTAVRLMPGDKEVHCNMAATLSKLQRFEQAEACCIQALEIDPEFSAAHYRLESILQAQGRFEEAERCLRRGLAATSDDLTANDVQACSSLLFLLSHKAEMDAAGLYAEHRRVGALFEKPFRASWPAHSHARDPQRRLKIGFVSGDLYNHAVSAFLEPVLEVLKDFSSLQIYIYSNNLKEDEITARLRRCAEQWHRVAGLSDGEMANLVGRDRIDILIDLSGHTALHRLRVFAQKPAPIQASWIGYPGTTGLEAMDYYFCDLDFLPPGQFDAQFTEKLVYLPAVVAFMPSEFSPPVNQLPALGAGHLNFGSFNRLGKINATTIQMWSALLLALPESRMLLGGLPSAAQQKHIIERFTVQGIDTSRLAFHARCDMATYLELHHRIDLCLDTHPYNGGTTTFHAAWMGIPTLTVAGVTPAAREGAALLRRLGVEGFTATDGADFVRKGIYWSTHLAALAELRAGMRARLENSSIGKPATIAGALEQAFRYMWRRWCDRLATQSFEATSDG